MVLAPLIYDENTEQIMLGFDESLVELLHHVFKGAISWDRLTQPQIDMINTLGDDISAYLHLKGVKT